LSLNYGFNLPSYQQIDLANKHLLIHFQIEKRTNFSAYKQKTYYDSCDFEEASFLLPAVGLFYNLKKLVHTASEHLIKYALIIEFNLHNFDFFEGGHFHADAHHDFVEMIAVVRFT